MVRKQLLCAGPLAYLYHSDQLHMIWCRSPSTERRPFFGNIDRLGYPVRELRDPILRLGRNRFMPLSSWGRKRYFSPDEREVAASIE